MPSRSRTIEDSPSVLGTVPAAVLVAPSVLKPIVPQWLNRHQTEKIPAAEKRRLDKKRKANVEQRARKKPANETGAPATSDSILVFSQHFPAVYGPAFERLLSREAVAAMVCEERRLRETGCDVIVIFATIGDGLYDLPPEDRPRAVRKLIRLIERDARRDGLPALVLTVYGYGAVVGLHAHIFAVVERSRVQSYRKSAVFGPFISGGPAKAIKMATRVHLSDYLLQNLEQPGPITGGRLRLSTDLKRHLVDNGRVPPFETPHLRLEPAAVIEPVVAAPTPSSVWRFDEEGQGVLFEDLSPRHLPGPMLRVVRTELGLSQAALGAAIGGIRQPHVANAERNHDRLSAAMVCRVISLAHERLGRARVDAILADGRLTA